MGSVELGRVETEREYPYRGRLIAWSAFVGFLTVVNWAGRLAEGKPDENSAYQWSVSVGGAIQFLIMLGIVAFIARGAWDLLALRRPRSGAGRPAPASSSSQPSASSTSHSIRSFTLGASKA